MATVTKEIKLYLINVHLNIHTQVVPTLLAHSRLAPSLALHLSNKQNQLLWPDSCQFISHK